MPHRSLLRVLIVALALVAGLTCSGEDRERAWADDDNGAQVVLRATAKHAAGAVRLKDAGARGLPCSVRALGRALPPVERRNTEAGAAAPARLLDTVRFASLSPRPPPPA